MPAARSRNLAPRVKHGAKPEQLSDYGKPARAARDVQRCQLLHLKSIEGEVVPLEHRGGWRACERACVR